MSVFIIAELNHVRVCTCMKICMNYNHTGAFFCFGFVFGLEQHGSCSASPLGQCSTAQPLPWSLTEWYRPYSDPQALLPAVELLGPFFKSLEVVLYYTVLN